MQKKLIAVFICVITALFSLNGFAVFATNATTTTTTTPKTTKKKNTSSVYQLVKFKESNPNTVNMLKSITLTIETMGITNLNTKFTSEDTTIATVEKLNNTNVKVIGLREGAVYIYAECGDKSAKFRVFVRSADGTMGGVDTLNVSSVPDKVLDVASGEPIASEFTYEGPPVSEEDIFDDLKYEKTNPVTIVVGIIGWGLIIIGIMLVVTIILQNRNPRTNRFPGGSRNRFSKHYNKSKRILPDHYYRNLKKW